MTLEPGSRLQGTQDAFAVQAVHGEGGFGITYRCQRERDALPVIAKVLRMDRLKEWKSLELFEREAKVLRQLHHDNIPDYVDYFPLGDAACPSGLVLIQELVEGVDLARRTRGGERLDEPAMLDWFVQLLEVLVYLHALSPPVIHRDVTPKNIVLRDDGRAFLVDFGTVQAAMAAESTLASTAAGTFGYAPPEQFVGRASPASDLYGLAMSYLAVATGQQPEDLPVNGLRVDVRAALRHDARITLLLEAMTEPDPRQRLDDAREALARLEPLRARAAAPAAAASLAPTPPSAAARPDPAPAPPAVTRSRDVATDASSVPPIGATAARRARLAFADDQDDDDAPRLPEDAPAARIDPLRDPATWIAAERRVAAIGEPWPAPDRPRFAPLGSAALSFTGERLVIEGDQATLELNVTGERVAAFALPRTERLDDLWIASRDSERRRRVRSPDGKLLAVGRGNDIKVHVLDPETGKPGRGDPLQADCSRGLLFSPDGAQLVALGQRRVAIFERSGEVRRINATALDFRPDGRLIAIAEGRRLHLDPGDAELDLKQEVTGLRFSADGLQLAVVLDEGKDLLVLEITAEGQIASTQHLEPSSRGDLALLGFSGDRGRLFAFGRSPFAGRGEDRAWGVLVWSTGGPLLGALHLGKSDPPRPVFVTPQGFWERIGEDVERRASPWNALQVVQRVLLEGRSEDDLLDDSMRAALEDFAFRDELARHALPKRGARGWREVRKASAGLTHLWPQVLVDAERHANETPRFGKGAASGPEPEDLVAACKALAARPPEERAVIFEDMLRELAQEHDELRVAAETAEAAEQAEDAEREERLGELRQKKAVLKRQLLTKQQQREEQRRRAAEAKKDEEREMAERLARIEQRGEALRARQNEEARRDNAAAAAPARKPAAQPSSSARKTLHSGHAIGAAFVVSILGLVGLSWALLGGLWEDWQGLAGLGFAGAVILLIVFVVYAFHDRCPVCRGVLTRKVLSKSYSHTSTTQETVNDSSGGHRHVNVTRKIYNGSFRCRRCGHYWSGYM